MKDGRVVGLRGMKEGGDRSRGEGMGAGEKGQEPGRGTGAGERG